MRIFRCNFAIFSRDMPPDHPRMVVPSALTIKLICDEALAPSRKLPAYATTWIRRASKLAIKVVQKNFATGCSIKQELSVDRRSQNYDDSRKI